MKKICWKITNSFIGVLNSFINLYISQRRDLFLNHVTYIILLVILFHTVPMGAIATQTESALSPGDSGEVSENKSYQNTEASHYPSTSIKLHSIDCHKLLMGQFNCSPPELDMETQQPVGCTPDNYAIVNCTLRSGLVCDDGSTKVSLGIACQYTTGYSYETALLLSVFLGMFGLDRFYLGYPAIGLLKFCTLGFLFLGQFIDIVLIAMQVLRPADGSFYTINQYGPKLHIVNQLGMRGVFHLSNLNYVLTNSEFDPMFYLPTNNTNLTSS